MARNTGRDDQSQPGSRRFKEAEGDRNREKIRKETEIENQRVQQKTARLKQMRVAKELEDKARPAVSAKPTIKKRWSKA